MELWAFRGQAGIAGRFLKGIGFEPESLIRNETKQFRTVFPVFQQAVGCLGEIHERYGLDATSRALAAHLK